MTSLQADLELTALHIRRLEARLAAQRAKTAVRRAFGRQTDAEDEALRELAKSLEYLKDHFADITAPVATYKASAFSAHRH
jgi:transposase